MNKVLFITNSNLLPSHNGAVIYSFGLVKWLRELGKSIVLVNFYSQEPNNATEIDELKKYCDEVIQIKLTNSEYWKNISLRYPITIKKYFRKEMISVLSEISRMDQYDIAIYDHLHMGIYQKYVRANKHILVEHNVETDIWNSYLKSISFYKKVIIKIQTQLINEHEKFILNNIKNIIAISDKDALRLKEFADGLNVNIFRPHVNCERIKEAPDILKTNKTIIFVGSYKWFPNQQAARFLATKLMPQLRQAIKGIKLYLVGTNPTPEMIQYGKDHNDIIITGQVDSVDPYIKNADIFINTIESGSGLNIKVLEAMGKGIPLISSEFGVRGFGITHDKEIIVYKSLDDLIVKVCDLMNSTQVRLDLSNNGIKFYKYFIEQSRELESFFS